jgi:RNA polymerase sigma-70 factor (ECF subfamily)
LTDTELLERLRAGDQRAFDEIFRAHYARLVGVAESIVRDRAIAEEVAQDVMMTVWRLRDTIRVATSLAAYLYRSTRNRALNHVRRERVERAAEPYAGGLHGTTAPTDAAAAEQELEAATADALERLPPRCREVFELSRVDGLKYAEIAAVLDISVKTVEAQMGKALRIMREELSAFLK